MDADLDCPACRKPNPLDSSAPCVRCEADLNPVRHVMLAAIRERDLGHAALQHQEWRAAHAHASRSWALRHSTAAARLAFCAAMADPGLGDPATWLARAE